MGKIKLYIMAGAGLLQLAALTSCEKDLPVYSDDTCRLNFYYNLDSRADFKPEMAESSYSFVYGDDARTRDTVWFKVETMGKVPTTDRPIAFEQVDTAGVMAVPGTHYVAFDSPELAPYYVIKGGQARAEVPVILLRDASLKNETVVLKFRIRPNGYFTNGYEEYQTKTITFSDYMTKPAKWDYPYPYSGDYTVRLADLFGAYGPVKHQFMIEHTGEKWDDAYIDKLMTGDLNYVLYLESKLSKELETLNKEREQEGLKPLAESDGTEVSFEIQ